MYMSIPAGVNNVLEKTKISVPLALVPTGKNLNSPSGLKFSFERSTEKKCSEVDDGVENVDSDAGVHVTAHSRLEGSSFP